MLTPSEGAIDAMIAALNYRGMLLSFGPFSSPANDTHIRVALSEALVAGAEHLTDAGQPLTSTPTDRFYREPATDAEMNTPISDQAQQNVLDAVNAAEEHRHRGYEAGFSAGKVVGRADAEAEAGQVTGSLQFLVQFLTDRFANLEAALTDHYDHPDATERALVRAHTERMAKHQTEQARLFPETVELVNPSGPADYEVWRDALNLAAIRQPHDDELGPSKDAEEVRYRASHFARILRTLGRPPEPDPDEEDDGLVWDRTEDEEAPDTDMIDGEPGTHPYAGDLPNPDACPECRAGEHDNCPGAVLDPDQHNRRPCPCAGDSHPESLG